MTGQTGCSNGWGSYQWACYDRADCWDREQCLGKGLCLCNDIILRNACIAAVEAGAVALWGFEVRNLSF